MTTTTVASELDAWLAAARDVVSLLSHDDARLTRTVPAVSGWSPVHHAAHMTLANELVVRNVQSLAKGNGLLVVYEAAQNPDALAILASGRLPRGRAKSPRMVVPPADVDLATAREWAATLVTELETLVRTVDGTGTTRCFVPHQLLGPLDLAQWVRFGNVHTNHHLAIAREVLAGPA